MTAARPLVLLVLALVGGVLALSACTVTTTATPSPQSRPTVVRPKAPHHRPARTAGPAQVDDDQSGGSSWPTTLIGIALFAAGFVLGLRKLGIILGIGMTAGGALAVGLLFAFGQSLFDTHGSLSDQIGGFILGIFVLFIVLVASVGVALFGAGVLLGAVVGRAYAALRPGTS